jgi:adenine-specific DNA-methyltransferase
MDVVSETWATHRNEPLASACAQLGRPTFEGPGVAVFHGDSLEMLARLKGQPVALTVTSPPYNIGKAYEETMPVGDYLAWCAQWIQLVHSVTRPDGAFWLNLGYLELPGRAKAVPIPYLLWDKVPFYLIQEVVWNYGAGVAAKRSFSPRNEKFLWYVKDALRYTFNLDEVRDKDVKYPNQRKNGKLRCNPLGKNPSDVWQFPKVTSGANRSSAERTSHPAQFPVAVVERIIKACSEPGDLVLDPFLGSGTVAEVALRLGRQVIGIEISEAYVQIAADRVTNAFRDIRAAEQRQGLFAGV